MTFQIRKITFDSGRSTKDGVHEIAPLLGFLNFSENYFEMSFSCSKKGRKVVFSQLPFLNRSVEKLLF